MDEPFTTYFICERSSTMKESKMITLNERISVDDNRMREIPSKSSISKLCKRPKHHEYRVYLVQLISKKVLRGGAQLIKS